MKAFSRALITVAAVALCLALGGRGWAQTPGAGLIGTVHDFAGATGLSGFSGANTQPVGECTFCHTPHRALSTTLLWNHAYSGSTYEWDVTSTTAGTTYPVFSDTTWNGPSAKCLSCHDGTVAVGQVNWFEAGHGDVNSGISPIILSTGSATGLGLTTTGLGTAAQATSLSGVHPIAMPYPYGQVQNTYNGVTTGTEFYPSQWQSPPLGNVRLWQQNGSTVSLGYNGSTGAVSPTLAANAGIECTSCHDVHNKLTKDGPHLLVGLMYGDGPTYICNMCHFK